MVVSPSHPATPAALGVRRLRRTVTDDLRVQIVLIETLMYEDVNRAKSAALSAVDSLPPMSSGVSESFIRLHKFVEELRTAGRRLGLHIDAKLKEKGW
jgi:hypothetical protein